MIYKIMGKNINLKKRVIELLKERNQIIDNFVCIYKLKKVLKKVENDTKEFS